MATRRMNPKQILKSAIVNRKRPETSLPTRLSRNFRSIDEKAIEAIKASLVHHYFARNAQPGEVTPEAYLATNEGQRDLTDHATTRLTHFRNAVVPWLDAARRLAGASILEIGCGTGSSTVASRGTGRHGDGRRHGRGEPCRSPRTAAPRTA